jgi:hypothetical protein
MSPRVLRHTSFLRLAGNECCSAAQRRQLIRTASGEQIKSISECCHNLLKRHIPLTPKQRNSLKKYKKLIFTLVDKSVPISQKRQKLEQSGGFLPALVVPIIGAILGGLAHNAITR